MNSSDLAEKIGADQGMTRADARKLIDAHVAALVDAAATGEEISLSGLGKFRIKRVPARDGRNSATGEAIRIKASAKLTFTPAKAVKARLKS